ncbi:MAG: Ig-like domain-containing protein [Gammaproteobacteria bacterium]|nr:Ig-like domain-containing protein [Gammaproteobacteria bacterium]
MSPATSELEALGAIVQLSAEVRDQNGEVMAGTTVTWNSSTTSVATVDQSGLVMAVGDGTAVIAARVNQGSGATGTAIVTVTQSIASVEVSPSTAELTALGASVQLTAGAFDANGHAVVSAELSWESSDAAVATVNASGLVTGVAIGVATITASSEFASGSAVVAVMQPAASVEVSPSAETIGLDASVQLTAGAFDANGHAVAGAEFSWESSNAAVATVDASGLVTGIAEGVVVITASSGSASGAATITVVDVTGPVVSVKVSPSAETIGLGGTLQLMAEGFNESGHAVADAEFSWESSNAAVATVDASGLVTGITEGVAVITASSGGTSGAATITVVNVTGRVASVVVAPREATITALGDTLRLAALAFDENGQAVAGAVFSWMSGDRSVATVDERGLVTAVAEGMATITANVDASSGSAEITVRVIAVTGTDRDILVTLYKEMDGPDWKNAENWLTDAPIGTWYGVETDSRGRVTRLSLSSNGLAGTILPELGNLTSLRELILAWNGLTGPIPPELGNLASLEELRLERNALTGTIPREFGNLTQLGTLNLQDNHLTGPIPPEFGNLTSLRELNLPDNAFTGSIPPEFGSLTRLRTLNLHANDLTGPIPPEVGNLTSLERLRFERNALTGWIPPEVGNLTRLRTLNLHANDLAGPIPPELGNLAGLEELRLEGNALTGPVPPELGRLTSLTGLHLSGNSGLAGILPTELTRLDRLETLLAVHTDLCAPSDPGFQAWLGSIYRSRIARCASDSASVAYLTQAVQSLEYPVPLVAGEKALLRVFVTATSPTMAVIPPIRARFSVDGTEIHIADIPARTATIPTEVYEGDLSRSSNAEIPGEIVRPGLEMVVEIDPEETLDPGLGVTRRIPETGRMAVDVREMPVLHLTVIPFLYNADPHWEVVETVEAMEADPEGHELLWHTHTLLPIGDFDLTAHAPVLTSTSYDEWSPILGQTEAIRAIEGGSGHYMGTMSRPGREGQAGQAQRPGRVFISRLNPTTMAHELGHNLSLYHAPCGAAGGPDPAFPTSDGSIGAWGYDFRNGGALASPGRTDLMSYCESWISDYHFTNALRFRLFDERPARVVSPAAQEAESLLLWGGIDAEGEPFLNPSFVVDAPPLLPNAAGEHGINGRSDAGNQIFSFRFDIPEVADGDGSSSFAFVLPMESGWAGNLESVTLLGPYGSVALDRDTNIPMSILVDPNTGEVRGILRDTAQADAAALSPQVGLDGLDVLFSRGIPDAAAWGR